MAGFRVTEISRGQFRKETESDTDTTTANTYIKVAGTFVDGDVKDFRVSGNKLVYEGMSNCTFLLNGVSDLLVDKACVITYGLFVNDVLYPNAETPHTFLANAKISNISITGLVTLNNGDVVDVYCKSSVINTKLTISTLIVTLFSSKI